MAARVLGLLCLGAGAGSGAATGVAAKAKMESTAFEAHTSSASVMLAILKDLKLEAEATIKQSGSAAEWCRSAREQQLGMADVLGRRLDEATTEARQASLDEDRLGSELRLANSTSEEQARQLRSASSTASFAEKEFVEEGKQVSRLSKAAKGIARLLASKSQAPAIVDASMDELSANGVDLPDLVDELRNELAKDEVAAKSSHEAMLQKLASFNDHMSSSLAETHSQVAAISAEGAHRRREIARLHGKAADLSKLIKAVEAMRTATEAACSDEETRKKEASKSIAAESSAIKEMLRHLAANAAGAGGGSSTGGPATPPVFLQVTSQPAGGNIANILDDIQDMGGQMPDASEWHPKAAPVAARAPPPPKAAAAEDLAASVGQSAGDALQDIQQFVTTDLNTTVESERLPAQSSAHAKYLDERKSWCASMERDVTADVTALERSAKRAEAKLRVAQSLLGEYNQTSHYSKEQAAAVQAQLAHLNELTTQEDQDREQFAGSISTHTLRLTSLLTDLKRMAGSASAKSGKVVAGLLQHVESHEAALRARQVMSTEQRQNIEAKGQAVIGLLVESVQHDSHRFAKLQAEAERLSALSIAAAGDVAQAYQAQAIAQKLCPKSGIQV